MTPPPTHTCHLCGRQGTRDFQQTDTGHWICTHTLACQQRESTLEPPPRYQHTYITFWTIIALTLTLGAALGIGAYIAATTLAW